MEGFGLGLVLNFTDNATGGMGRVINTFETLSNSAQQMQQNVGSSLQALQNLNIAGFGMNMLGEGIQEAGKNILGTIYKMVDGVTKVGTEIFSTRMTLNTLFKSAEEGEKAFDWVKDYAKTSIFNFKDLLPATTIMKAVGIDVRKELETTTGKAQNLLDYAGDLAAIFPNMRNSYGTGVQASMGALKEYIAEGNAITLKRGAGLDITGILGEEKGTTIEERSRQVADLIDKIGAFGMTANLAGTPMQRLSNISDVFFNLVTDIAEGGVFEKFSQLVERFSEYIFSIPEEEMKNIAKAFSDAIVALMTPIDYVISVAIKVIDWMREMIKERPQLAKLVLTFSAFVGVMLVGIGVALKFGGALLMLIASVGTFMIVSGKAGSILMILKASIKALTSSLFPLIAVGTLLFLAWKYNIFGVRDSLNHLLEVFGLVFDAFTDDTLAEDKFIRAKEMGILPFIEGLIELKYRVKDFAEGFVEGFTSIDEWLGKVTGKFTIFKDTLDLILNTAGKVMKFFTGDEMSTSYKDIGRLTGGFTFLLIAIKALSIVYKLVVSPLVKVGKFVAPFIGKIFTFLKIIGSFAVSIAGALGVPVYVVALLAVAIAGLVVSIVKHWDEIKSNMQQKIEAMKTSVRNFVNNCREFFGNIPVYFNMAISGLANFFKSRVTDPIIADLKVWKGIVKGIFQDVKDFFSNTWNGISTGLNNMVTKGKEVLGIKPPKTKGVVVPSIPARASGDSSFEGGLVQVNEEGGEIVNLPNRTQIIPHDKSLRKEYNRGVREASGGSEAITFGKESIVVYVQSAKEEDIENIATKIERVIEKRRQVKKYSRRKPIFEM